MLLLAFGTLLISCTKTPTKADLQYLSGYWEIEQVTFPNGETRDFPPSTTTVDFYHLEDGKGLLKKVQPEINGRFSVNAAAITLSVLERENHIVLLFNSQDNGWEETLEVLNEDRLETRHENGLQYRYHRYEPFEILE
ncbi:MAG: hypothetical protein RLZZ241_1211 [Bacteroidota bacterium]|jgi:hypothetical protein